MEDTGEVHLHALREQFEPAVQLRQKRTDKGKVKTQGLSDDDILQLHQAWQQEFTNIVNGTKEELFPWREVNHEINHICEDVAKARYRSKIDLTDAYKQVCIRIEDIPKMVFTSLMETF
ncbi:hypothetical protein C0995_004126, partial [Termitomyces sp. Mi166